MVYILIDKERDDQTLLWAPSGLEIEFKAKKVPVIRVWVRAPEGVVLVWKQLFC